MRKPNHHHQRRTGITFFLTMFVFAAVWISFVPRASAERSESSKGYFQVTRAEWKADDRALKLKGSGATKKETIVVKDAATGEIIGTTRSEDEGKFEFEKEHLTSVPCALLVENDGRSVTVGFTAETQKKGGKAILIREAQWKASEKELMVKGQASPGKTVALFAAPNGIELGSTQAKSDGTWRKTIKNPPSIPCRIQIQLDGATAEMAVKDAPGDCESPAPPTVPTLTGITLNGPVGVKENSQTQYTATAAYSDGSTKDITSLAKYTLTQTPYATINGNRLSALEVTGDTGITLNVDYTEGGNTRSATLQITVLDVPPAIPTLTAVTINGPLQVNGKQPGPVCRHGRLQRRLHQGCHRPDNMAGG